jgi:hypothetical protein
VKSRGKPYGWTPQTELEHFMRCPVCHKWFDMRDLVEAFEHYHDGPELQQNEKAQRPN